PQENTGNLRNAIEVLSANNPSVQIVLTVSPIPLRATYMDRSVVVSNAVSKASLLWAAHEISAENERVHYFPSYEIVKELLDAPYAPDNRHVTQEAVTEVMRLFSNCFVLMRSKSN